jgi:hypothetical protein
MSEIHYHREMEAHYDWTSSCPINNDAWDDEIPQSAIDDCLAKLDEQWFETDTRTDTETHESAESIDEQFRYLADLWRRETENLSSITRIVAHSAYQKIIEIGKRNRQSVIRLILTDLDKQRSFWAVALNAISGDNPVPPDHIGNPSKVREDWLKWGKRHGHIR